ncbi:MAG TPA: hypothetical protein PLA50_18645, partial [Bacteroidia bacterium]|nr:hypothetical protein [Bacteroidia bacterium]
MTPFDQLPKPIFDKLRSMIRRVRRLIFLRGLFATLAVGLVCLLAVMAVDAALTPLSSASRWSISLAGLAATLAAAWWFLLRPLSRRLTIEKMARILEIRHPELQERISTAVELLASDDPDSIRGSQELIATVVDSAVGDIATVDPKTEFRPGRSKRFMAIAAAGAGVLALLLAVWPQQSWTLLKRAFAPHRDIGNAYADALVVEPGDLRVARGEAVSIEVLARHRRLDWAEVRRRLPDGTDSVERMTLVSEAPDGTRRFSLSFPSVEEAFAYRVRAGGAVSRYFDVAVVDPPAVERLTIRYDFPDYTGLPDAESVSEAGGTGEIRALAHTRVTVVAAFNKPVAKADLRFGEGSPLPESVVEGQSATWQFELVPAMRGSWQLDLADAEGFVNRPATYPVEVLPDRAPAVRILTPAQREIRVKPTEILPLDLAIDEDFGIADLVLLATPEGASAVERPQPQPVATDRSGQFAGRALLEIPALGLTPEQRRISVQAR